MPGYTTIDPDTGLSEHDAARAAALANRITAIDGDDEREQWAREGDYDNPRYDTYEPDPCDTCDGTGHDPHAVGPFHPDLRWPSCPAAHCEDGYDMRYVRDREKQDRERAAAREIELDWLHEQLTRLGARIMRPYEHWNEEERYMQYMESDRWGE